MKLLEGSFIFGISLTYFRKILENPRETQSSSNSNFSKMFLNQAWDCRDCHFSQFRTSLKDSKTWLTWISSHLAYEDILDYRDYSQMPSLKENYHFHFIVLTLALSSLTLWSTDASSTSIDNDTHIHSGKNT